MKAYLLARLGEASTYRGIFALATALGVFIAPELQNAIITIGLTAIGFFGLTPDKQ